MSGIEQLAETVATDMEQRLPGQRKTQRGKLALLVATEKHLNYVAALRDYAGVLFGRAKIAKVDCENR